jgi:hypothetical protein
VSENSWNLRLKQQCLNHFQEFSFLIQSKKFKTYMPKFIGFFQCYVISWFYCLDCAVAADTSKFLFKMIFIMTDWCIEVPAVRL